MTTPVDFDYNGPPVSVSNGMAMQLVTQFGPRSAWFAFLKLRGMQQMTKEEAEAAHKSLAYFCNKIGHLREKERELAGKGELEQLISADFDTFLEGSESLELKREEELEKYDEVEEKELAAGKTDVLTETGTTDSPREGTTATSLLEVIEQSKQRQRQWEEQKEERKEEGEEEEEKVQKDEQKQEKGKEEQQKQQQQQQQPMGLGASQTIGNKGKEKTAGIGDGRKEEIARRHAETIDDVVSLVMEKIRNNQPFEGELIVGSNVHPGHGQGKSHHGRRGKGQQQQQRRAEGTEPVLAMAQTQQHPHPSASSPQQHLSANSAAPVSGTFGALSPGQSIVLVHNPATGTMQIPSYSMATTLGGTKLTSQTHSQPQQQSHLLQSQSTDQQGVTILSNFSEIIRSSNSSAQSAGAHTQAIASRMTKTAQASTALGHFASPPHTQLQSGSTPNAMESTAQQEVNGVGGAPIELAIQQNMTVQELIQTLKAQSRHHQNAQIHIVHHGGTTPNADAQLNVNVSQQKLHQQDTPDSSSQEAAHFEQPQKMSAAATKEPVKKGRKRKAAAAADEATPRQSWINQPPIREIGTGTEQKKEKGQAVLTVKGKKGGGISTPPLPQQEPGFGASTSTGETKVNTKEKQRMEELEAQLRKVQKQLTVERNKSGLMKKRVEKVQAELDKSLDSIQLLQIDLACQKTDNNNLIAENIALKAENQQLRTKGLSAAQRAVSTSTAANAQPATNASEGGRGRTGGNRRGTTTVGGSRVGGRGRKILTTVEEESKPQTPTATLFPDRTLTPPPLSSELGRRQSKRICVARSQFMKNLF